MSNVSLNENQVTNIIKDMIIPVISPKKIPSLVGKFFEIDFFSTFKYHTVGTKKIQILQETKNICDKNSLSIIPMPKITDADGIKATNNMAMRGLSCNCIIYPIRINVMNIRPAIESISH